LIILLKVFADVFQRQVYTLDSADSAATGVYNIFLSFMTPLFQFHTIYSNIMCIICVEAAVRAMDACGVLDIGNLTNSAEKQEAPTVRIQRK